MNLTSDCDWRGDKVGAFYAHLSQAHRMKFLVAKEKVRAAVARNQKKANPISTQLSTGKPRTHLTRLLRGYMIFAGPLAGPIKTQEL